MAVGKLSGGEQSRLLLAQLMLREAQVLVLDEPTNDLDLATLAVLEETLTEFDGAVLLVSHDRYFVDQVATTILAFDARHARGASVVPFADLAQWEAWRAERRRRRPAAARRAARPRRAGATPAPAGGRAQALGYIEQREYDAIEADNRRRRGRAAPRPSPRASGPRTPATPPGWWSCSPPSSSARQRSIGSTPAGRSWKPSSAGPLVSLRAAGCGAACTAASHAGDDQAQK